MSGKLKLRRNDMVQVMCGAHRGTRGRVLRAIPREGKVVVEGVNTVWKHVKPSQQHRRGGRVEREAPVNASNVMLLCQNRDCARYDKPVRIRMTLNPDRTKSRACVKCGNVIPTEE